MAVWRWRVSTLALGLSLGLGQRTACQGRDGGAQGPAHAYVAAAASAQPRDCRALDDAKLQGECLVFVAHDLATAGAVDQAEKICEGLDPGIWQDECWFNLADAVDATGTRASALCDRAGRFKTPCLGHVISRDSRAVLATLGTGQEAEGLQRMRDLSIAYVGTSMGTARARQNMRKALASRMRQQDFDPALCGSAPRDLCADAYVEMVTLTAIHGDRLEDSGEHRAKKTAAAGDPAAGDPAAGDPAAGDPAAGDPAAGDPAAGDPAGDDRQRQSRQPRPSGDWRTKLVCDGDRSLESVRAQGLPGWVPAGEELAQQGWESLCKRRVQHPAGIGRQRMRSPQQGSPQQGSPQQGSPQQGSPQQGRPN